MLETLAWTLVVLLMLTGLAGTVVPLLPGTTLILLGMLQEACQAIAKGTENGIVRSP